MKSVTYSLAIRRSVGTTPRFFRDHDLPHRNLEAIKRCKPFHEMPSVKILPVVGSAWSYLPFVGRYRLDQQHLADWDKYRRYGPVVKEKYGKNYLVLSFNEQDVKSILFDEELYPTRSDFSSVVEYRKLRPQWYRTVGLTSMKGKEWYDLKMALEKYFSTICQPYKPVFEEISKEFVSKLLHIRNPDGEVTNFFEELSKWSLESLGAVALDRRLGSLQDVGPDSDATQLLQSMKVQLDCMSRMESSAGSLQTWKYLPNLTWKKYVKAADNFSKTAFRYIKSSVHKALSTEDGSTFLGKMVMDKKMEIGEVMIIAADVLFEGINTTSSAFTFMLYHLAKNPDKQEILYNKIMERLGSSSEVSFESVPYLANCFQEAMRLHPVSRGIARTFDRPMIISGYLVPPEITILCITQIMGRNDDYFRSPNMFLPDRWLNEETRKFDHACLPFGANKRSCLGRSVAEFQMTLLLVELLRRCKVEYLHGKLDIRTKLINVPVEPVPFKFVERLSDSFTL